MTKGKGWNLLPTIPLRKTIEGTYCCKFKRPLYIWWKMTVITISSVICFQYFQIQKILFRKECCVLLPGVCNMSHATWFTKVFLVFWPDIRNATIKKWASRNFETSKLITLGTIYIYSVPCQLVCLFSITWFKRIISADTRKEKT